MTNAKEEKSKMRRSIMPGPYPPPPPDGRQVNYTYWIGDRLRVKHIDYSGIVTMVGNTQAGRNLYLIDNGKDERWYAGDLVGLDYDYHTKPGLRGKQDVAFTTGEDKG